MATKKRPGSDPLTMPTSKRPTLRLPDAVLTINANTIPAAGREFNILNCERGVILPMGSFTGLQTARLSAGVDFFALPAGMPLPQWKSARDHRPRGPIIRPDPAGIGASGVLTLLGWALEDGEEMDFGGIIGATAGALGTTSPEADAYVKDIATASFTPLSGTSVGADGIGVGGAMGAIVWSNPFLWNPTNGNADRQREVFQRIAANPGRAVVQDGFEVPVVLGSGGINMNVAARTTIYTGPGSNRNAEVYLWAYCTAFTAAATFELELSGAGGTIDRFVTAAVGNVFRNYGPIPITGGDTITVNVVAAAVSTVQFFVQKKQRDRE